MDEISKERKIAIKSFGNSCRRIGGEIKGNPYGKSYCKLEPTGKVELDSEKRRATAKDADGEVIAVVDNVRNFESAPEDTLKVLSWGDEMRTELEIWTW